MIRFEAIEEKLGELAKRFRKAKPFPHVVIDDFADPAKLARVAEAIPDPAWGTIRRSRDYFFARNKFEKSEFRHISAEFAELYENLISGRFEAILRQISGEALFVDRRFFGGGIHQGGAKSFLDLHADFNYHPLRRNWFRNLNILLYLNRDWQPEWGGQLRLKHAETGECAEVEPLYNRCAIMTTRNYTLHGYDPIDFPPGRHRQSIAAYAYSFHQSTREAPRSITWAPERASFAKRWLGQRWPTLVRWKNALFGPGTGRKR
jgi:hypothetical protein